MTVTTCRQSSSARTVSKAWLDRNWSRECSSRFLYGCYGMLEDGCIQVQQWPPRSTANVVIAIATAHRHRPPADRRRLRGLLTPFPIQLPHLFFLAFHSTSSCAQPSQPTSPVLPISPAPSPPVAHLQSSATPPVVQLPQLHLLLSPRPASSLDPSSPPLPPP